MCIRDSGQAVADVSEPERGQRAAGRAGTIYRDVACGGDDRVFDRSKARFAERGYSIREQLGRRPIRKKRARRVSREPGEVDAP